MGVSGDGDPYISDVCSTIFSGAPVKCLHIQMQTEMQRNQMCTTAINVQKQRNIIANIQSPLTEVIYRLNYF